MLKCTPKSMLRWEFASVYIYLKDATAVFLSTRP